jgi:hypothetical protein
MFQVFFHAWERRLPLPRPTASFAFDWGLNGCRPATASRHCAAAVLVTGSPV